MRIRTGYILRQVLDQTFVMSTGGETYAPGEIMSLNEAGALLWRMLENGCDREALAERLMQEYGIGPDRAARDVDIFLARLRERALIEE